MKFIPRSNLPMIVQDMRRDILTMCRTCGAHNGHLGGCMSSVEILAVLYTQVMNIFEASHSLELWENRDRFIMSKGHAGIAMYAALKHVGLIPDKMIHGTIRGHDSILFRHPKINTDYGIECSVGSLGQGICYGLGLAESFRRKGTPQKVFVMVGDGECNEGSVWEAAAYAGHRGLDNFIVIIDKNRLQLDGFTSDILSMENMAERWHAFGFVTAEADGHNFDELISAFQTPHEGKPLAIICNTVKGRGISFAENNVDWHDNYLTEELYSRAMEELGNPDLVPVRESAWDRFATKSISRITPPPPHYANYAY